jgi:hypothetical protein
MSENLMGFFRFETRTTNPPQGFGVQIGRQKPCSKCSGHNLIGDAASSAGFVHQVNGDFVPHTSRDAVQIGTTPSEVSELRWSNATTNPRHGRGHGVLNAAARHCVTEATSGPGGVPQGARQA